ncbi:SGS domain-containing protein [Phyllosticta citriasiana]|uniref:SGS domain-containing protein n=1 Tax=Phyllosticta citriasiana TaxID=595635 RepID=UPI0030FDB543
MAHLAAAAAQALESKQYDLAIENYTQALTQLPEAVPYYIGRCTAYQRKSPPELEAALKDAEIAVKLAHKRAKRELIAEAQLRRAITLFSLGRYKDAEKVLEFSKKYKADDKTAGLWSTKVANKLKELPDATAESDAQEIPKVEVDTGATTVPKGAEKSAESAATTTTLAEHQKPKPEQIRHDWYEDSEYVYVTLLAKGIPKDEAVVEIEERSLSISIPTQNHSTYQQTFDPLRGSVDPQKSSYNITAYKMEIKLKKANPFKWSKLEAPEGEAHPATTSATEPEPHSSAKQATTAAPSYPSSSRSGPKNWDKLANDLAAKGDDGDELDNDGGDPAAAFFKKLYKDADPDTRRAMMKSYQESNGTALSTNWKEVSKAPVETSPPDGMVAKKWE